MDAAQHRDDQSRPHDAGAIDRSDTPQASFAPNWQRTLFLMMGTQLGMNLGFTVLSPVMPLFLPQLGVRNPAQIDLWAGILAAVTPLVAAFASPLWGRVADRRGRKLMGLAGTQCRRKRVKVPAERGCKVASAGSGHALPV